jgi:hypothetical protein
MKVRACLVAAVLGAVGCRTPRPASIERWEACVVERGKLERAGGRVQVVAGAAPVLILHARWGEAPGVTEYTWGELDVELAGGLGAGAETRVAGGAPPASWREGSEIVAYDADALEGSVRVAGVDARSVSLDVDLRAAAPNVDLAKRGALAARGRVTARRVATTRECW